MKKYLILIPIIIILILGITYLNNTSENRALSPEETIEILSKVDKLTAGESLLLVEAYLALDMTDSAVDLLYKQLKVTPESQSLWVYFLDLKKQSLSSPDYYKLLSETLKTQGKDVAIKRLDAFIPKPPKVSHPSGTYQEAFSLNVTTSDSLYLANGKDFEFTTSREFIIDSDVSFSFFTSNDYGKSEIVTFTYALDNIESLIDQARSSSPEIARGLYEKILDKQADNEEVLDALIGILQDEENYEALIYWLKHGMENTTDFKYSLALRQLVPEVPRVNVNSGTYTSNQLIQLTNFNAKNTYYYTLDGNEPTIEDQPLTKFLNITPGTSVLKIIAVSEKGIISETATYRYTVIEDQSRMLYAYDKDSDGQLELYSKTWEDRLTDGVKIIDLKETPHTVLFSPNRQYIAMATNQSFIIIDSITSEEVYNHSTFEHYGKFDFGKDSKTIYIESNGQLVKLDWKKDHYNFLESGVSLDGLFYRNEKLIYANTSNDAIYYKSLDSEDILNFTEEEGRYNMSNASLNLDNHALVYETSKYSNDDFSNDLIYIDKQYFTGTERITKRYGQYTMVEWVQNQSFLVNYKKEIGGYNQVMYMGLSGESEVLLSLKDRDVFAYDYR